MPAERPDDATRLTSQRGASGTNSGDLQTTSGPECLSGSNSQPDLHIHVYKCRWLVLATFSCCAVLQNMVLVTWGPLSYSTIEAFGWSPQNIVILTNFGFSFETFTIFGSLWVVEKKGLRVATLGASGLILLATALRCITSQPTALLWLASIAAILNGMAGSVTFAVPTFFSAAWFPANQRTTATSIVSMSSYLGVAFSFLVGPSIVHNVNPCSICNHTLNSTMNHMDTVHHNGTDTFVEIQRKREELMHLMYLECGLAGLLFLVVLVYFPAKPPLPPSVSASSERIELKKGLIALCLLPTFWIICIAYALPVGTYGAWEAVWIFDLQPLGVSEVQSGWIGFYTTIAFVVTGVTISRFSDIFMRHMKAILIGLYVLGSVMLACCVLIIQQYISVDNVALYITMILAGVFVNGGIPLFFELACEVCFPVSEVVISGILAFMNLFSASTFFFILLIPHIGHRWMVWFLLGSTVAAIPMLFALKDTYSRLAIDSSVDNKKRTDYGTANDKDKTYVDETHAQDSH